MARRCFAAGPLNFEISWINPMLLLAPGIRYFPEHFDPAEQAALVEDIRAVVTEAPLYVPAMPKTGKEMSVRMTNCGVLGWVTDKEQGYRYQARPSSNAKTLASHPAAPAGTVAGSWRFSAAAGGLPRQFLFRNSKNGPASGSRRAEFAGAGCFGIAGRRLPVPLWRHEPQ